MGAIATALGPLVHPGAHLVVQQSIYGGTTGLLTDWVRRLGVRISQVPGDDPDALRGALQPDTAAVYLETVSNPVTLVADIAEMAAAARAAGVPTVETTPSQPRCCAGRWRWAPTWWCTPRPNTWAGTPT
jgi:methionine-gamma-lyase